MEYDLEQRLIKFSLLVMGIVNNVVSTINGITLAKQLSKSGTSVSLYYGEAQNAESRKDFIHKMKIVLKELRETHIFLELITRSRLCSTNNELTMATAESKELILIFARSIETAKANAKSRFR